MYNNILEYLEKCITNFWSKNNIPLKVGLCLNSHVFNNAQAKSEKDEMVHVSETINKLTPHHQC